MGLKRRAAGRKQVLDLNERQDSPRRSWQTKYQQICVEHNTQNGNSPDPEKGTVSSTSSKVVKNNPLSGLLANYHSDSEGDDEDEEKDTAKDLDSKVSDFMKEIQTIVPSGSSIVVPGQLITTPGIVELNASQPQQQQQPPAAISAWQECYDETTGYIYYWHTETNDVTWETPAEYLPQSMSSSQAADVVGQHEASSLHIGLASTMHQSGLQVSHDMHTWSHPGVPMAYPMLGLNAGVQPQPVQAPGTNDTSGTKGIRPLVDYNSKSADKASSDSEEERIEMITSFGESSDEDSEEEIKPPVKRKKPNIDRTGSQFHKNHLLRGTQDLIGPKLQSCDDLNISQPDSEQMDEGSNLLSNKVDDFGPPGVEMESKAEELVMESEDRLPDALLESGSRENSNVGSEPENDDDKKITIAVMANENSMEADSTIESVVDFKLGTTSVGSDGEDSTETDEVGILSRLRTQAKVLKELGGELPAEVQQLIEPADAEPTDADPSDAEPADAEPADAEPSDAEPANVEPADAEPADVEPPDAEPADAEPGDAEPGDAEPADAEPADAEPAYAEPAYAEPADEEPAVDVTEKSDQEQPSELLEKSPALEELPQVKEPEQSSNLPDFEKEMERMEEELKELTRVSQVSVSVESSPKTTSFALIAGYGDDSDQEDESDKVPLVEPPVVVQKRTFESLPTVPVKTLFPIAEHVSVMEPTSPPSLKPEDNILASEDLPSDKPPSPKVSHSILFPSVSDSMEVPLPALRLQESSEIGPDPEQTLPPVEPIIDSTLPKKASKRKKRLDISTSAELVAASSVSKSSVTMWTYSDSEVHEAERKGLGFAKLETDADAFLQDCITEFESKKVPLPKNKENITFVKGNVLNAPKPKEEIKEEMAKSAPDQDREHEAGREADEEASKLVNDLAQMILEKVTFLAEGKEPPSPVQVMAIQIETLVSAWHIGALSHSYLSKWLGETGDELGRLETSAAPEGWACQWDRSHKRYYYCNLSSGKTQWEYPELFEDTTEPEAIPELVEEKPEKPKSPEMPAAEDIAGGELAMEICNTPPHSPSPPPPSPTPTPPPREDTPPPPPPPTISETKELSPPPPPRISPFPPPKSNDRRRLQKGKNKKRKANNKKQQQDNKQSKKDSPKPPPPDLNPPLPPLPPPPSSPPPPPPSDMPPLPPSPPRQQLAYGEPLPPGVDPGELPYMAHPAPPHIYQPPEISPLPTADMETYQHAMQTTYVMAPYQPTMVQSNLVQPGIATNVQGGPVMDYSAMPYMMHTHMPMPAVIAKPPAKKHKAALHAALNSFYSDLATMEPTPPLEGVGTPAANPTVDSVLAESVPATNSEPCVEPDVPVAKQVDSLKKKKVKKVVGLGLKKKGVSSLVAKWQQVQQENRRDFETLDQDNKSCQ